MFEDCMFESGNQEVIDSSDCIMVAVLPSQAAMLSELRFRPGQQLVSLMAGLYPRQLRELCAVDMPISVVIPWHGQLEEIDSKYCRVLSHGN